jgi:hypothetical protein
MNKTYSTESAYYTVIPNDDYNGLYSIRVVGYIKDNIESDIVYYMASAPTSINYSFYGSGLAYPSFDVAFDNTPNRGFFEGNKFDIVLYTPNAYYDDAITTYNPPQLILKYNDSKEKNGYKILKLYLGEPILYRTQTYNLTKLKDSKKNKFYNGGFLMPVRTQEQILIDSDYPNYNINKTNYPLNHWGFKPPI